jgi:hypothetical protein
VRELTNSAHNRPSHPFHFAHMASERGAVSIVQSREARPCVFPGTATMHHFSHSLCVQEWRAGAVFSLWNSAPLLTRGASLCRGLRVTYKLFRLAAGSYDVLLNGVIIASLVRNGRTDAASWTAELLVDLPQGERPAPFTEMEHSFGSLEDVQNWLGGAELKDPGSQD